MAVPAPLRAGRDAGERALSRPAAEGRGRLLPGLREEHEEVPPADGKERAALQDLADTLRKIPESESAEFIQNEVYEAGKRHFAKEELRQWFQTLYEVLLGSKQGPRMGAFIKLYGRDNVVRLIERALAGEDLEPGGLTSRSAMPAAGVPVCQRATVLCVIVLPLVRYRRDDRRAEPSHP